MIYEKPEKIIVVRQGYEITLAQANAIDQLCGAMYNQRPPYRYTIIPYENDPNYLWVWVREQQYLVSLKGAITFKRG